jgi:aubergine-like protein
MKDLAVSQPPREERQQRRRKFDGEDRTLVTRKEGSVKEGTAGTKVQIVSNFFKVLKLPNNTGLFQYNVTFEPDIQSNKLKSALLHDMDDILGTTRCFDGMSMFLPKKLPDAITTKTVKTRQGNDITLKVMFTNAVPENSPSVVQLMNILFRKQLRAMKMQLVGRNYYHPDRKIDIRAHKMQVWPGISTSILQYESDVMLCADVAHKVLRQQTVLEFLYEIYGQTDRNRFYDVAKKKLLGEIILTRYNNKTYRVDDIDWEKHPSDTFEKADGTKITFKEYYETVYEKTVTDVQQPLLISRPKEKDRKRGMSGPILLLPEFCVITGLSDEIRANFSVMKDLAQHTRISPGARAQNLTQFMNDLNANPEASKELKQWNLQFDKDLLKMTGRCLGAEKMFQKGADFSYKIQDADWSKESRGKQLISSVNLDNWVLFYIGRDNNIANDFRNTLGRVCGPMGMQVRDPKMCQLRDDSARTYFEALKEQIQPGVQMVVCIVPNNRKDRYDAIKKLCCVEKPVPSQVVVSRTLSKQQMLMSVCTKIGIQLNCKLGGEVWAVDIPLKKLMVVGFDVYHDSLTKGKSIGGYVASTNKHLTRYYSRITSQTSHQEIADQLKVCTVGALKKYNEINGELPDPIIVYRDGVGDGQIKQVFDHEVPQFKDAFAQVSPNYNPKFAMIIVKKRVSTRLFLEARGQMSNPPPGTLVDSVVTRPEWFDFFLISQSVRQGTVTPTHYNVVNDSTGLKADHFQRLTYKLCHLYYNWPGTIRVPAPCQYAHKLAFLVGQSIHTDPDPVLADRLYYL